MLLLQVNNGARNFKTKKFYSIFLGSVLLLTFSCKKEQSANSSTPLISSSDSIIGKEDQKPFIKYSIHKGEHFCDSSKFEAVSYAELKFIVKFDSSAIYKSILTENQFDINKLYGFSDNNEDHHQFSARLGWRWSENELRLFGYIYNHGKQQNKELGTVTIGTENNCSIKVKANNYIFSLNGKIDSLPRESTTTLASGYRLFPYFGGDEVAPHDIIIWIKELK